MATRVRISATPDLEAIQPALDKSLRRLEAELNLLPPAEVTAVVEAAARALESETVDTPQIARALSNDRTFNQAERVVAELEILQRSFTRRHELLSSTLTTAQVAALLHTSRQTPHDRVVAGSLLAVMDRGALRFPTWQFDPDGPDGVVAGLPSVIRALGVSPMAKISWLTRVNSMLDGLTPLAALKNGEVERVVLLARGVGLDHSDSLQDQERRVQIGDTQLEVQRVLDQMSPRNRIALVLHEYGRMSVKDIGEIMGLSPATVRTILRRSHEEFRQLSRSLK